MPMASTRNLRSYIFLHQPANEAHFSLARAATHNWSVLQAIAVDMRVATRKTCRRFVVVLACAVVAAAAAPKHVLQIIVDDLGFSDLSYKAALYNITSGVLFPTPFIDSLALAGVRLESTYVHALCSPSRGAFLSGRYAYTTGGNAEVITDGVPDQLPTNIRTVADLLHAHGWATAAFGKWDVGMTTWGCTPLCRGFDHQVGYYNADED